MKRSMILGRASAVCVVTMVAVAAAPAGTASAGTPAWQRYVLGPSSAQVTPVHVDSRGAVSNPRTLVTGRGRAATLTTAAGTTPASVLLDFGTDVAGTPFFT